MFKTASPKATQPRLLLLEKSSLEDPEEGHYAVDWRREKKPQRQVDSNSGPLDYKAIALTTLPTPLPLVSA